MPGGKSRIRYSPERSAEPAAVPLLRSKATLAGAWNPGTRRQPTAVTPRTINQDQTRRIRPDGRSRRNPLWVPMIVVAAVGLARTVIEWCGRVRYEQVRAATVTAVPQALPGGAEVRDVRADGPSLSVEKPPERAWSERPAAGVPVAVGSVVPEVSRC